MQNFTGAFNPRVTPQQKSARPDQVKNRAGGFVWELDCWARLDRFLILGTEGGSYYVGEAKMTRDAAKAVIECLNVDPKRTVDRIVEISSTGRAPKNDPALFALALATTVPAAMPYITAALPKVARIGTHLFHFVHFVNELRGWGRGIKRAVGNWYVQQTPERLALQLVKYQQRDGWSHKDVLRLAHPKPDSELKKQLYRYVTKPDELQDVLEQLAVIQKEAEGHPSVIIGAVEGVKKLKRETKGDKRRLISSIQNAKLPRECIPTEFLKDPEVWEALLQDMPMEAMVRNLGTMGSCGLLVPLSNASKLVVERLGDVERIQQSRIHPIKILAALMTYSSGRGVKGSNTWTPVQPVVDALDGAFHKAFKNVQPSGKNLLLALDVSGSMGAGQVAGVPGLSPRIASAALALVTANVEKNYHIMGFSDTFMPLDIRAGQTLKEAVRAISGLPFAGTNCALPMTHALQHRWDVDGFVLYTDNETWAGPIHPFQALQQYRQKMNKPRAKSVVVGMTASRFSIADPGDPGMLDVVGFDTATPELISSFVAD